MRLHFIDNLRWVMILLVISQHASVTYNNQGLWYYNEPTQLNQLEQGVIITYEFFLQTFFMGILFFVAGYFAPGAYDRKGPRRFLKDRAWRLGMPTLLYMFILAPVTGYLAAYRRAAGEPISTFLREYFLYITRGRFLLGVGPLWFCVALLVFCCGYAAWRVLAKIRETDAGIFQDRNNPGRNANPATRRSFPGMTTILGFIGVIAAVSFLVRLSWPVGTALYNMQLCYFAQYIAFFFAGTLAFRHNWLTLIPTATGRRWGLLAILTGPPLFIVLAAFGGALKGQTASYTGGWHWQSLALCVLEAFAGVGISLGCITLFRERFNRQGRLAAFFSANAFAVYVFHPPILIAITRAMTNLRIEVLLKFTIAAILCFAITNALAATVFRRIPLLKNIL